MKPIALALLLGFGALHVYAIASAGIGGIGSAVLGVNAWSAVFFTDLFISLGLVSAWLYRDAKRRGKSAAGYIALTLTAGSFGPLLYLLTRSDDA